MAFPAVQSLLTQKHNSTSVDGIDVSMPASVTSGNLLFVFLSSVDASGWATPTGWTQVYTTDMGGRAGMALFSRLADGSEGGTTVFFDALDGLGSETHTISDAAVHVYEISDWSGTEADIEYATNTQSITDVKDCPSLTYSGGAQDILWIVAGHAIDDDGNFTGAPANYTNLTSTPAGDGTNSSSTVGTARRELNTGTEDPGSFTLSEAERVATFTIAVPPGTSGGGGTGSTDNAVITSASATPLASTDTSTATDNATLTAAVASVIASTDTSSATDNAQTTSVTASVLSATDTSAATDTATLTRASASVLSATAQAIASDAAAIVTASATPLTSTESTDTGAADNAVITEASATPLTASESAQASEAAQITQIGAATLTATDSAVSTDGATITPASVTIQTSTESATALDSALIVNAQGTPIASVETVQTDANITTVTVTPLTSTESTGTAEILLGTPDITPSLSGAPKAVPVLSASPEVVAQLKASIQIKPE